MFRPKRSVFIALLVLLVISPVQALAAKRVALVIGNDAYRNIVALKKAVNDAEAMQQALTGLGFEVVRATDVTRREMNRAIQEFTAKVQEGDIAMLFYAGHGVEINGKNYLLPVDIPAADQDQSEFIQAESMAVDGLLERLRGRNAQLNLLVLDACRNNPFARSGTRSLGADKGLARIAAPQGTFVMYSADVGEAALDRLSEDDSNPNSVFTRTLIPLMQRSDLDLVDTAREVRRQVRTLAESVRHEQTPAYYDAVLGDFYFSGKTQDLSKLPEKPSLDLEKLTSLRTPGVDSDIRPEINLPTTKPAGSKVERAMVVTGGEKDSIRLWDAETASMISELKGEKIEISTLKLTNGGRTLVVAAQDGALFSYQMPKFKKIQSVYPGFRVSAIAEADDGTLLIGGENGMLAALNPLTYQIAWQKQTHGDIVSPVLVQQTGKTIVTASGDGTVAISDLATGDLLRRVFTTPGKSITDIDLVTASTLIAVHEDGTIAYLNLEGEKVLASFPGNKGWISSVALSPDHGSFVTAGVDGSISFWTIGTDRPQKIFSAHSDVASGAKFVGVQNGNRMISTGFDGTLLLWDEGGEQVLAELDHGSAILYFDYVSRN